MVLQLHCNFTIFTINFNLLANQFWVVVHFIRFTVYMIKIHQLFFQGVPNTANIFSVSTNNTYWLSFRIWSGYYGNIY